MTDPASPAAAWLAVTTSAPGSRPECGATGESRSETAARGASGMTPAEELREAARLMRERADQVDSLNRGHATPVADALRPSLARELACWLDAAAEQGAYYEAGGAQLHPDSYALKAARAYLAPVLRDAQGEW